MLTLPEEPREDLTDLGTLEAELAAAFGEADLKDITVSARLDNLVNRVETLFAYNHVSGEYLAGDDGAAERDLAGVDANDAPLAVPALIFLQVQDLLVEYRRRRPGRPPRADAGGRSAA